LLRISFLFHASKYTTGFRITQDVPRYARLTRGLIVDAEPVASHPGLMRVKGFGAFENGALVTPPKLAA
jgi:hypothetical protein